MQHVKLIASCGYEIVVCECICCAEHSSLGQALSELLIYHACMPAPSPSIMPGFYGRDNGHKALALLLPRPIGNDESAIILE